jgi:hypothetical protein
MGSDGKRIWAVEESDEAEVPGMFEINFFWLSSVTRAVPRSRAARHQGHGCRAERHSVYNVNTE